MTEQDNADETEQEVTPPAEPPSFGPGGPIPPPPPNPDPPGPD